MKNDNYENFDIGGPSFLGCE